MKYKIMRIKKYIRVFVYEEEASGFDSILDALSWLDNKYFEQSYKDFIVIGEHTNETE